MAIDNKEKGKKRASNVLTAFNILFLTAAIAIIAKIVILQYFWEPDEDYVSYFQPRKARQIIEPERGAIIDHNGKLLALSTPMYDVRMDCCVMKDTYVKKTYKNDRERRRCDSLESLWIQRARELSRELPKVLDKSGKTAAEYEQLIMNGRRKGARYEMIAKGIDHGTLLKMKELPLFKEGQYYSGMIVEKRETRQYPYGELARRVIGYVKHNNDTSTKHIGIEGKYDYILHGKKGLEWKKVTDKRAMIKDVDSTMVAAEDGLDVRTTLDINIQDISDRALRRNMAKDSSIIGGCVVVLDVETGAVRSMVNLQKNRKGEFSEIFNFAAGRPAEPGSVFKAVTLTSLLEDGKVKLETRIPTKHGIMEDMSKIEQDRYITSFERKTGKNTISVVEGLEISSNYVFRRLAKDNYEKNPKEFINRLHEYNFGEAYDFDLTESGSVRPMIPDPDSKGWSIYDLVSVAIGYSVRVTPLQVATFYNAIANKGKMMKPYVVERTEYNGKTVKEFKPTILNGSICSKATADTLTRALTMVTLEGTASKLKNAKCQVAGKTGTSRIHLSKEEQGGSGKPYESISGKKKHQATFVGFFPADEPKYTAIVVVYTGLIKGNVYGGNIPVLTFKDIADELWAYEEGWGQQLKSRGTVPQMKADFISTSKSSSTPVPDLVGLGLKDAYYAVENNGYKCRHNGTGHVVKQEPEAGSALAKGETIRIELE